MEKGTVTELTGLPTVSGEGRWDATSSSPEHRLQGRLRPTARLAFTVRAEALPSANRGQLLLRKVCGAELD